MRRARNCFNILLALLALAAWTTGFVGPATARAAGTPATTNAPSKKEKPKKLKPLDRLRVHVEAKRELPERSLPAVVGRSSPLVFNVEKVPILNESHVENAMLVDQPGGFQVRVRFNSMGMKLLESYSTEALGRHLCIITDIDGEGRWLAAPLLRQRIGDGVLIFSPDATREEMERLVFGLNEAVRKEKKKWMY